MSRLSRPFLAFLEANSLDGALRQLRLGAFVAAEPTWELASDGVLSLDSRAVSAGLLGTFSALSHTFRWGDEAEDVGPTLAWAATRVRDSLRGSGCAEATLSQFDCEERWAWLLTLAAASALDAEAAFQANYEGGSAFLLVSSLPARPRPTPAAEVAIAVRSFVNLLPVPHRPYFDGGSGEGVVAIGDPSVAVRVQFDRFGRVERIRTT